MADHREVLNHVLGDDLPMQLLQQHATMNQYVGLWSVWWSNTGEVASARLVVATVLRTVTPPENASLKNLSWVVLQLQTMSPEDEKWPLVYKTLYQEIDARSRDPGNRQACPGRLAYDTVQSNAVKHQLVDADLLEEYTITRVDDSETRSDPKPIQVNNRKRIQYLVYRGKESDLRLQPVQVFIEKLVSKRAPLSQRLHSETGLSKTTSLLSAVNDWRTWIVLNP
jgi:hypothetical protein